MARKKTAAPSFEQILRTVVSMTGDARRDVEQLVGAHLPNTAHYAVLARIDALNADVTRYVGDTVAPMMVKLGRD